MEDYFSSLVSEDTTEAWAKVKEQMPWSWAPSQKDKELIEQIGLQQLEIDTSDEEEVSEVLQNSLDGTIFGEFYVEPFLSINDDFFAYVKTCLQLIPLDSASTPTLDELTSIYRSKRKLVADDFSPVNYMVIICPRCQLRFTEGDEDLDYSPDDCVYEDCIACDGSGEWVFELLF